MQKAGKKKRRIGAVILSLVMAVSMVFTPSAFTQKKVSASTPIDEMTQLQKWSLISRLLDEKDRYFENTPTDKAAAIYTAAEYYWEQGEGSVDAADFCSSVEDYFAGIEDFDESRLEKIDDNDFFKYDSDAEEVEIKGLSQGPTEECTYIGSTDEDASTEYGIWTDPDPADNFKPYYVALDTDEDERIVSYRKLPDEAVTFTFDAYEEDEDTADYVRSFTTSDNRIFIPAGKEAQVQYYITIKDGEDKMPVQFTSSEDLEEDIFELSLTSDNNNIVEPDEENVIRTDNELGTTDLTYEIKSVENGNVIYTGNLSCTSYQLTINEFDPNWWVNILPKESMTLKAKMEGYNGNDLTFIWNSSKYKLNNVTGQTCKITAPSSTGNGKVSITPYINGEPLQNSYEHEINVRNCKLGFSARDMHTFKTVSGALKVGTSYMLTLDDGDWGWNYKNGDKSFYTIKFTQNKKSVTATNQEKNLKADFANIGIGAGGGNPNRVLTPKKAGKLTITGTIYRNGKAFKTVTKTFTIQEKVTVSKTTLSSVKNLKGKKMQIKWKKNTAGHGYQIQYSTSSKFAKGNKTKTISKNKTTSYTATKLTKKKTYYVRIRTYKKVSGKTYYSGWSSVKKVKITK